MRPTSKTLGELLLITVGVFIALAAERWVSGNADRSLAESYVADLAADLEEDSATHAGRVRLAMGRSRALAMMIDDLNGVGPRLEGAEALRVLFLAQNVPTGGAQDDTYRDLVGSGNLRLLRPQLRRSIVEYYAQLERNKETMTLFSWGKPRFADLVPGRAKGDLSSRCRNEIVGAEVDCAGEDDAPASYALLPAAERESLNAWRTLPEIRMEIQSEITEANNLLRILRATSQSLEAALASVRIRAGG